MPAGSPSPLPLNGECSPTVAPVSHQSAADSVVEADGVSRSKASDEVVARASSRGLTPLPGNGVTPGGAVPRFDKKPRGLPTESARLGAPHNGAVGLHHRYERRAA